MYLISIAFVLAVQFLLHNAATIKEQGRIYKGRIASPNSAPYQVALFSTDYTNDQSICGGSLITTKFVLTAAHCLYEMKSVRAVLGTDFVGGQGLTTVTVYSKKMKCHEKYDELTTDHDIGIVELPSPVKLNKRIALINLPKKSDANVSLIGKYGRLTGWGVTADGSSNPSSILKELRVRLVNENDCLGFRITPYNLCGYGESTGSACVGDSGGPLILEKTKIQIGLVSYGAADGCSVGHAHVYTKVYPYLDWIKQNSDYK